MDLQDLAFSNCMYLSEYKVVALEQDTSANEVNGNRFIAFNRPPPWRSKL